MAAPARPKAQRRLAPRQFPSMARSDKLRNITSELSLYRERNDMNSKIAGTDLGPMAFESELSVLMRIAWRNAFDSQLMREYLSSRKLRFQLCRRRLFDLLGWVVEEEELTADNYYRFTFFFISPLFRYCPICLEGGYHSYLYQCLEIRCCPIHDIALSMKCQCCGRTTSPYRAYSAWFFPPYFCSSCSQPICGAAPLLEAHLDFRAVEPNVFEILRPHYDRWQHNGAVRFKARVYGPEFATLRATWAERAEIIVGIDDLVRRKDRSLRALKGLQFNWSERTLMGAQIIETTAQELLRTQKRLGSAAAPYRYPELMKRDELRF